MRHPFLRNKYTRWYKSLIASARSRKDKPSYVERHHILPISLGGKDTSANLVDLTAREHFIAHLLLTKMTEGLARRKMSYAFSFMLIRNSKLKNRIECASRWYEYSRKLLSETQKGRQFSQDTRDKMRQSAIKRFESADERKRVSTWTKNPSKKTRAKIGEAARNRTPEAREKMRLAKSRKCTIDGKTVFSSLKELGMSLGWGRAGARSPSLKFLD